MHGHFVTLPSAHLGRGLRHGERHGKRQILVDGEMGVRGGGSPAGESQRNSGHEMCSPEHEKSSLESRVSGGGRELTESVKLRLFEVRGNLVDAGLGAGFILVASRRARNPDGADDVVTDLDRQRALGRDDVGQKKGTGGRSSLYGIRY